jgi:hypothetical protein
MWGALTILKARVVPLPDGCKAEAVPARLPPSSPSLRPHCGDRSDVYLCDPRTPWQRGSNENANRLLRQYLAKSATSDDSRYATSTTSPSASTPVPGRVLDRATAAELFLPRVREECIANPIDH